MAASRAAPSGRITDPIRPSGRAAAVAAGRGRQPVQTAAPPCGIGLGARAGGMGGFARQMVGESRQIRIRQGFAADEGGIDPPHRAGQNHAPLTVQDQVMIAADPAMAIGRQPQQLMAAERPVGGVEGAGLQGFEGLSGEQLGVVGVRQVDPGEIKPAGRIGEPLPGDAGLVDHEPQPHHLCRLIGQPDGGAERRGVERPVQIDPVGDVVAGRAHPARHQIGPDPRLRTRQWQR
jgi:hypothetical protein